MYQSQCKEYQMGQSNGVLLKEVAAFPRCPLTMVPLYCHSTEKCLRVRELSSTASCDLL